MVHVGASDLALALRNTQVWSLDGLGVDTANSETGQMLLHAPWAG